MEFLDGIIRCQRTLSSLFRLMGLVGALIRNKSTECFGIVIDQIFNQEHNCWVTTIFYRNKTYRLHSGDKEIMVFWKTIQTIQSENK